MLTLKDIAKELNLNPSTVSRALHDNPSISFETKKRVIDYAKKINYFPNTLAQSLQKRKSKIIGVIVPEIKHDFFSRAIDGIEDVTYDKGYTIMVCKSNENYEREVQNIQAMISNRVAGVLASVSQNTKISDHFKLLLNRNISFVFFDRVLDDIDVSKVIVDDYNAAFNAVQYLINKGYKRIAHLAGPTTLSVSRNRLNGYKDALIKSKIPFNPQYIIYGGFNEEDGIKGYQKLLELKDKPDAILAVNDPVAIGIYMLAKEKQIMIPDDLAVIGFSDNPISSLISPALTTVEQPAYEIGMNAAKLLIEQINNKKSSHVIYETILKTKLIVREST